MGYTPPPPWPSDDAPIEEWRAWQDEMIRDTQRSRTMFFAMTFVAFIVASLAIEHYFGR
jgi:hypothetical protein